MNHCIPLLLAALLAMPVPGFGQQQPASRVEALLATAQQAGAAHDYAAAANAYRQAVRVEPGVPELWANLGLMQHQAADNAGAIVSLQQANHLNPSLYVPNLFLGIDYLRAGKTQEAIPFLIKAEKINATDPEAPLALGRAYFAAGKYMVAARELGRATVLDPKLGAAWFDLGIDRLNQVEADARKMSTEAKDSPFAGALYAESLEKQARFNEAATLYRSLLASHPQPPCLLSELGFALLRHRDLEGAATEFSAERTAQPECGLALLGQARMAIEAGDNEQAARLLNVLGDRDRGFFESNAAMLLDGLSNERATSIAAWLSQESAAMPGDLRRALLAAFNNSGPAVTDNTGRNESSVAQTAERASAALHTAEAYYAAGEFEHCAKRIDPAVAAGHADKLRLLAACSFFAGDYERTSKAAAALEALQPHSPEALYWSIQANERLALQSLARFQQLDHDSARSHVLLGDIYSQLERFDDAQTEYGKALAISPGDPAAMLGLASAYLSNNNIDKAMETARLALGRAPDDPELNLVMAEGLLAKYEFAEAEPYLKKSLNAKPQIVPHVHALIGKAYAETGRTQEAIEELKLGASSDVSGSLHYQLARLYRKLGDDKDASVALEEMTSIRDQRRARGVKAVEDPDLSALESTAGQPSTP